MSQIEPQEDHPSCPGRKPVTLTQNRCRLPGYISGVEEPICPWHQPTVAVESGPVRNPVCSTAARHHGNAVLRLLPSDGQKASSLVGSDPGCTEGVAECLCGVGSGSG